MSVYADAHEYVDGKFRISRSADGGMAVTFLLGEKHAWIECFEDGEDVVCTSDGKSHDSWVLQQEGTERTLTRLRDLFLGREVRAHG